LSVSEAGEAEICSMRRFQVAEERRDDIPPITGEIRGERLLVLAFSLSGIAVRAAEPQPKELKRRG